MEFLFHYFMLKGNCNHGVVILSHIGHNHNLEAIINFNCLSFDFCIIELHTSFNICNDPTEMMLLQIICHSVKNFFLLLSSQTLGGKCRLMRVLWAFQVPTKSQIIGLMVGS